MFYNAPKGVDPDFVKELLSAAPPDGDHKPFHFYGLTAQFKDNGYIIETLGSGYVIKPATGTRADDLVRDQKSIIETKASATVLTLEKKWEGSDEGFLAAEGQETFCAHLADMGQPTGIPGLDDKATLWQAKWCFPTIQPGAMVNDKGRLWLMITLHDLTGQTVVTMDEKTALKLSGRDDKDTFLQAVRDGDPVFLTIMSAKIVRKLKVVSQRILPMVSKTSPL